MPENNKKNLELNHSIGDTVQLQFFPGSAEDRHYVKLIGILENKSLIVTTPRDGGAAIRINPEQEFIVRLVTGNSAKGFNATTIHSTSHPYHHLYLTYPENLESTTVRKAERIDCKLIVTVASEKTSSEAKSASMQNLSTVGAQLTSNVAIGDKGEQISINSKVNVAHFDQYLNLMGIIRRVTEPKETDRDVFEYGIEFIIPDNNDKLLLHAFIYEQLLNISN